MKFLVFLLIFIETANTLTTPIDYYVEINYCNGPKCGKNNIACECKSHPGCRQLFTLQTQEFELDDRMLERINLFRAKIGSCSRDSFYPRTCSAHNWELVKPSEPFKQTVSCIALYCGHPPANYCMEVTDYTPPYFDSLETIYIQIPQNGIDINGIVNAVDKHFDDAMVRCCGGGHRPFDSIDMTRGDPHSKKTVMAFRDIAEQFACGYARNDNYIIIECIVTTNDDRTTGLFTEAPFPCLGCQFSCSVRYNGLCQPANRFTTYWYNYFYFYYKTLSTPATLPDIETPPATEDELQKFPGDLIFYDESSAQQCMQEYDSYTSCKIYDSSSEKKLPPSVFLIIICYIAPWF